MKIRGPKFLRSKTNFEHPIVQMDIHGIKIMVYSCLGYAKKTIYQKKGLQKTNLDFYKIYCIIIIMDFYSLKLKWSHIKLIKISKNRLDTTSMSFWILLNKRNPCFKIDLLKK